MVAVLRRVVGEGAQAWSGSFGKKQSKSRDE